MGLPAKTSVPTHIVRTNDPYPLAILCLGAYCSPTSCAYNDVISPQDVAGVTQVLPRRSPASSPTRARNGVICVHCPYCHHEDSRVVDSRTADDGAAIRRRRQCPECSRRFTTTETAALQVQKRSGVLEPFSRSKVAAGVKKACQGRPVSEDDLAVLAQKVEDAIRALGNPEVPAHEVGMAILGPLRQLDEVAYLRFASVYRSFDSLEDFEAEIALLRVERETTADLSEPKTLHDQQDEKQARTTK